MSKQLGLDWSHLSGGQPDEHLAEHIGTTLELQALDGVATYFMCDEATCLGQQLQTSS
jgi:hypothetical protein